MIVSEWILVALALVLIIARVYLRIGINRQRLEPNDWLLILAFLFSIWNQAYDIVFLRMNVLRPDISAALIGIEDIETMRTAMKYFFLSGFPFYTAFYLCKASILNFYFQIFPSHAHSFRFALYFVLTYTTAALIVTITLYFTQCIPLERQWSLGPDACSFERAIRVYTIAWGLNISCDMLIFILPFLILHKLQMRRRVKIGVYCIFGLGIVNMAVSLTRFLFVGSVYKAAGVSITTVDMWNALDANIGLIIACLPPLRTYLRYIRFGSRTSHRPNKIRYAKRESENIHGQTSIHSSVAQPFDAADLATAPYKDPAPRTL